MLSIAVLVAMLAAIYLLLPATIFLSSNISYFVIARRAEVG